MVPCATLGCQCELITFNEVEFGNVKNGLIIPYNMVKVVPANKVNIVKNLLIFNS